MRSTIRNLAWRGALPALLAVVVSLALEGCNLRRMGGSATGGEDDFDSLSGDMKAPGGDLRGLPTVDALPPVVPEARGRAATAEVVGPRQPRVAWAVSLPVAQPGAIREVGADGTVYFSGSDGVAAVRDGKLLWAYHARSSPRLTMADDGRIWFAAPGAGGYYCLNRAGEGGLLPYSMKPPPDAAEPRLVGCSGSIGNGRVVRGLPGGSVPLDYDCTRPQAKLGPDGTGWVGTDAPDLRAIAPDGSGGMKFDTPCAVEELLAGPGGRAFYGCKDHSLHYVVKNGTGWKLAGDGTLDEVGARENSTSFVGLMDRNGSVYYLDHPDNGHAAHVHAGDSSGKPMWSLNTSYFMGNSMRFDGKGRIYLAGMRGMHGWLVCISD